MIVALIDNGSLEPVVHRNLRSIAGVLAERTGVSVRAVSWKHSDRISEHELENTPAWTLAPFIRSLYALGQREFIFIPFFISAQGAIGSALRHDLETLQKQLGDFHFTFTDGLAARGVLPNIIADRVRACIRSNSLSKPAVMVVDHGGPSAASATLRDHLARQVAPLLARDADSISAVSMEGVHPPLLADKLRQPEFTQREVVVAPLFLSPGRHAGPEGDLEQICRATHPHSHLTDIVGTHPLVVDALAGALRSTLSTVHAPTFA